MGYQKATLRRIGAEAGVDPALVLQFFTSKEQLFRMAVKLPLEPSALQMAVPRDAGRNLGSRVVRTYLQLWESPEARDTLTAMLVSAGTHDDALRAIQHYLRDHAMKPVAAEIRSDARRTRIALATSQLVGLAYARYVMKMGPLARASVDRLVELVAPIIDHYLTGDLAGTVVSCSEITPRPRESSGA
ncbi:MAG: TetR/AcrR family transcriptional regulator [Gaiellales bacterium]|nr:TetR/AcrR family transcriptional regulator [Gaiellales bacterium]